MTKIAVHQHRISAGLGQIGGRAHGDGCLGAGQYRNIVDAIPHHDNIGTAALQAIDVCQFLIRRHAAMSAFDAECLAHILYGR